MTWINFLHLYQPANSPDYRIREATEMSYLRIVRALEEHENVKFTLNISGCLVARWREMGYEDLIRRIGALVKAGRIELVGSAAYHPLLPLIPADEVRRQIRENEEILRRNFGAALRLQGFFMPEMAYGAETAALVREAGYRWIILDEISKVGGKKGDDQKKYIDQASGLEVVFRNREASRGYVPDYLLSGLDAGKAMGRYLTATDGELYGLRHIDHTAEFEKILERPEIAYQTVSEYLDGMQGVESVSLRPSSWESKEPELARGEPYKLWSGKGNKIHQELWRLARFAAETIEAQKDDANYQMARWHFVRGLASCTFWWASGHDFKLFSMKAWSPDEVENGLNDLVRSVRSLSRDSDKNKKLEVEKFNIKIRKMIWEKHWKKYE